MKREKTQVVTKREKWIPSLTLRSINILEFQFFSTVTGIQGLLCFLTLVFNHQTTFWCNESKNERNRWMPSYLMESPWLSMLFVFGKLPDLLLQTAQHQLPLSTNISLSLTNTCRHFVTAPWQNGSVTSGHSRTSVSVCFYWTLMNFYHL